MSAADVMATLKEAEVKFVDFRFTDTKGKEQHVTVPTHTIDDDVFEDGKMFDGSSISGWKGINESDMILLPDPSSAVVDVFADEGEWTVTVVEAIGVRSLTIVPRDSIAWGDSCGGYMLRNVNKEKTITLPGPDNDSDIDGDALSHRQEDKRVPADDLDLYTRHGRIDLDDFAEVVGRAGRVGRPRER